MTPTYGAARLVLLLFCLALIAQPAEARRRFGLGSAGSGSSGETIDPVRDLPDTETFRREGEYWDLGYLYRRTRAFGVTLSSSKEDGFFVLYRGERYVKLDAAGLELLAGALGEDPTAGYRSGNAPAEEGGETAGAETAGLGSAGLGGASAAGSTGGGSGLAGALFGLLIVVGLGLAAARKIMGGATGLARFVTSATGTGPSDSGLSPQRPSESFEQRVAARLAELERGSAAPLAEGAPAAAISGRLAAAPASAPAVRGFGRKAV